MHDDHHDHHGRRALAPLGAATTRTIVVNGREHLHHSDRIGHRELAAIAFPGVEESDGRSLTASYSGGPEGADRGVVPFGGDVDIDDGQRFSVCVTDKS